MDLPFVDRIGTAGSSLTLSESGIEAALRQGEALHREFRPHLKGDYVAYLRQMAREGASLIQLVDENEVRALAIWRTFLTTYCGRRFEVDDLVTGAAYRSRGYGATLLKALEVKAHSLSCNACILTSATRLVDAHRVNFRERYTIDAFQFSKKD